MRAALRVPALLSFVCALTVAGLVGAVPRSASAALEPSFVVRDMDGHVHDVSAALGSGKTVTLIFWQTWCKSCEGEAPELAAAAKAHVANAEFYGIVPGPDTAVNDAEVRGVAKKWGYPFPQVRDRDLSLTRKYGVMGTPTIVVLGPGGKTLYRGNREPKDWTAVLKTSAK